MPEEKKKEWATPKLIILTRGKPEERVLAACKTYGAVGAPQNTNISCVKFKWLIGGGSDCNYCSALSAS